MGLILQLDIKNVSYWQAIEVIRVLSEEVGRRKENECRPYGDIEDGNRYKRCSCLS
jgi:hypothetical protein